MRLPATSVCLSVSKITQSRAWIWMTFCMSTGWCWDMDELINFLAQSGL